MQEQKTPQHYRDMANTLGGMSKFFFGVGGMAMGVCAVKAGFEIHDTEELGSTIKTMSSLILATTVVAGPYAVIQRELENKAYAIEERITRQQG
ncbi:MAG: hypothetical protein QFB86_00605 [Patescibacteria group bacterium]|nr:hypothetical protein [Patescibacteria group bacterium]